MTHKHLTISILLMINLTGALIAQDQPGSVDTLRVLTFNIYHGATMKGDFDLDLIAGVIKGVDPDLVALQEVDFMTRRARGYDLATEFGWRTKRASLFGRAMFYDGGEYGEGILSRYSFIASRNIPLPFSENHEPRAALEVTTVLPSGDTIMFIGTHFDHTGDETDRILQARKINEILASVRYPVILAGDLNAEPGSTPINILEEYWGRSYDSAAPAPTYPCGVSSSSNSSFATIPDFPSNVSAPTGSSDTSGPSFPSSVSAPTGSSVASFSNSQAGEPRKKIDYVMYYPKDRWKVISAEVIHDTLASDHCAYFVILELNRSRPRE